MDSKLNPITLNPNYGQTSAIVDFLGVAAGVRDANVLDSSMQVRVGRLCREAATAVGPPSTSPASRGLDTASVAVWPAAP